jgi:hypothetical protein
MPTVEKALREMPRFMKEFNAREDQIPALEAELEKFSEKPINEWNASIFAVGTGHGFVVQGALDDRYIITAASCLPWLPRSVDEHLYPALLGPFGSEQTTAAKCCFVDPVSDVAVLCQPDSGLLPSTEWSKFLQLTGAATPLAIADPPAASLAWILSPDGRWFRYVVRSGPDQDLLIVPLDQIHVEMAGVPIVSDDGTAVGVLRPNPARGFFGADHPALVGSLPRRLLRTLGITTASAAS